MSVRPRGTTWEVYVKRGTERVRLTALTEAQGIAMEAEVRSCLAAGRAIDLEAIKATSTTGKKTLREVIDLTVAMKWRGNKSVDTAKLNADLCARILGEGRAVESIDHGDIDELVEELQAGGNSDATINRKMSALRVVLELAQERGWHPNPPKLPHTKERNGRIRFMMGDEEARLLELTRWMDRHEMADLWVFLMDTGARIGEALKLAQGDVTATHATFWDTKNGHSRTVPLTARCREIVARRRNLPSPFPMSYAEARHVWDRVKGLMGLDGDAQWVIHMLRHSCASRLVQRGVQIQVVMQWLGHRSVQMTMRYAHLAPTSLDAAVGVLDVPVAPVAELVDAPGLGPDAERLEGSSPFGRTNLRIVR